MGRRENTRKSCKSLAPGLWFTSSSRVFPASRVRLLRRPTHRKCGLLRNESKESFYSGENLSYLIKRKQKPLRENWVQITLGKLWNARNLKVLSWVLKPPPTLLPWPPHKSQGFTIPWVRRVKETLKYSKSNAFFLPIILPSHHQRKNNPWY